MSVRAMNEVAVQREKGGARRLRSQPKSAKDAKQTEQQGYLDLLVRAIPTEPLALYTFLIAGIVATIDPGTDQRLTMRWLIFAITGLFIVAWMIVTYLRRPSNQRERKLPWAEVTSATVAFAAWGLVMPESPLAAELSGTDQTVWTFIIVAAGVAILGLLTGSMKKEVSD